MIRDVHAWEAWEARQLAAAPDDYRASLRWAGEVLAFAKRMGVFPPSDPLEGIDQKIRLARIVHCSKNSLERPPRF